MFGPLFELSFWFDLQPSAFSPVFEKSFFLFFALMVLIGAVARIVARYKKGERFMVITYKKIAAMLFTMGMFGMLWFFFSFEQAYLLGARFWFVLWLVGLLVWFVAILRYSKIHVPAMKAVLAKKASDNKYMPRKKSKR